MVASLDRDGRAATLARVVEAVPALQGLLFHFEVAPPHGFAPSAIRTAVEAMRAMYPETDGPGSRPILVVVDFVQLIGDEDGDDQDLRIRIGRASYVCRHLANTQNIAVVGISSVARERYKLLNDIRTVAGLTWKADANGYPVERHISNTDAIVGAGKESGELEYSADSVTLLARVPETWDGQGCDVVVATAKGRATGSMWSPLHFTGFRYQECADRGGRMLDAWKEAGEKRERAKEEKATAKGDAQSAAIARDAAAISVFVAAHPGCSVREARIHAVADQARRWTPAVAHLGREGSRSRVGCANDRPCKSTRYLLYDIALVLELPTVVASCRSCPPLSKHRSTARARISAASPTPGRRASCIAVPTCVERCTVRQRRSRRGRGLSDAGGDHAETAHRIPARSLSVTATMLASDAIRTVAGTIGWCRSSAVKRAVPDEGNGARQIRGGPGRDVPVIAEGRDDRPEHEKPPAPGPRELHWLLGRGIP